MPIETMVSLFVLLVLGVAAVAFCVFVGWFVRQFPGGQPAINNRKCRACNRWFAMVEQSGKLLREDVKFGIPTYSVAYRCRWCGAIVLHEQQTKPKIEVASGYRVLESGAEWSEQETTTLVEAYCIAFTRLNKFEGMDVPEMVIDWSRSRVLRLQRLLVARGFTADRLAILANAELSWLELAETLRIQGEDGVDTTPIAGHIASNPKS